MKAWKAELLLVMLTLIWGGTFTFTKLALTDITPLLYILIRFILALVIIFIFFGKYLFQLNKTIFKNGLLLGAIYAGGFILQTVGLQYTTVSKSAFITGMAVVFTPFAYYIVTRKVLKSWQLIGVIVAFAGLWLFTHPDFSKLNIGDMLTLLSAVFWGFYLTYMDVFTKDIKEFSVTMQYVMMQFIVGIPISLLGYFIFESNHFHLLFTNNLIVSLLYNGIMASVLLTIVHTSVQKYSDPNKVALIFSLEPVFACIIAFLAINEMFTKIEFIGAIILFLGVISSEAGEFLSQKIMKVFS